MNKNPDSIQHSEHPDELLPWFVNQSLSNREREQVESHLQKCGQCQKEVELLSSMRQGVKNLSTPSPGEVGLERLLNEVKGTSPIPLSHQQPPSNWRRVALAIAASVVIVVQAGLLVDLWFLSKPMVPLAGPEEHGVVLQVSFYPTATETEIRQSINAVNGMLIGGPGPLGVYRIRLPLLIEDERKIKQAVTILQQQRNIVNHAARD